MRPLPPNYSSKRLSIWREFSGRSSVSRVWLPGMRRSAHPLLWRLPAAEPCARELRLRMPTMCFQLGRLPALDGQSPETGDDVCRGAPVCLQSPSTECAAPEACNAHYHAPLQHSLPLRPRQQAPGHALRLVRPATFFATPWSMKCNERGGAPHLARTSLPCGRLGHRSTSFGV